MGLKQLPEGDVGAHFAGSNRGIEGAFQHNASLVDGFDGRRRYAGGYPLPENAAASLLHVPFDVNAGGLNNAQGGEHAFGTDAISG